MSQLIKTVEEKYQKPKVVDVRSGDTVRVHQKIKEGNKERVQVFEGFVIRTRRKGSLTSSITVRRIASGVGVEKSFLLNSPIIVQVEVVKRSKVRRKYLSYMRERQGKSARLSGVVFDKEAVNLTIEEQQNVEAGLDKDANIEDIEEEAKADQQKADNADSKDEESAAADSDKPQEDEPKPTTKEQPETAETEKKDKKEAEKAAEDEPKKISKEEKAKLKKEKAKAFQKEKEGK
ncbi:MAG: 50S ribosomal protein L19 [Candidatus Saccharimonadales bacterium]|nr:50S ribosomal protein L19 [Candidatus Saccharimonadales bacterium]